MEGEDKEFTELKERVNKTLEERYPNWKEPIEELKAMDQYLTTCAEHDYPSEGAKEEEKDMLDPKIYKGICNKLSKINIYVKEEVIPEIIQVFKTLLRILNSEISSGKCHPEIMEASEVLFKVNESFFRSHRIEAPEKKTKESEKESEEKDTKDDTDKKEDKEQTGETEDVKNWGAPDDSPEKTNNNADLLGLNSDDPEIAGHEAAIAKQNQDEMAAEDTKAGEKTETPDGDGDTEELDKTGNQADDEYEDQSKYFEDGAYNNADTTFTPDKKYDYEYDDNLLCMIYTGPEFELGELVDALKTEQEITTQTLTCWEQAKVVEDNPNYYVIQFIRDYPNFKTIQKDVFRTMMFKYETHTRHNYWRYWAPERKLNLMVEVYHQDRWQLAKIMSTCDSINGEVDMANLVTFPDPDNVIDMSKSDFPQYPIRSPRIRLPNGQVRYLGHAPDHGTTAGTETYPTNVGTYGGSNSTNSDGKTSIHVLLCQEFVRIGTHQAIVERISNKENPLPIEQVVAFLNILVVIIVYIREHTDYDSELQSFNQIVLATLEDYVENDLILPSIKEFKHEYFKAINQAIVKFRLGNEFNQRMATLIIECAKRCLNSAYLSVRVQGCKEIESRCSTAHRSNTSHLSKDELAEWLSKNQIIKSIFGANHHSELIKRSEYMLKILSRSKIGISEEEIKLIWNLTKRDKQTKKEIYTILGKVGDLINDEAKVFIFDRLKEYDNFLIDDINFLYSFKKNTDFQLECTWKILNNSFNYEQEVVQSAFSKLEDMMKFSSMEKKLDYINKSIAKLASGDMSLVLIRILKATLKNINLATARVQNMGDQFETAKDELLLKFYENFNTYCETVEEICVKDDRRRFNAAYECFVDTFNHEEHLKEKLAFISELYKLYKITITKEHIDLLWKCLSMTRIRLNIELYFKWLNDQIEAYNSDKFSFLTGEIIEYFFTERILNEQNNYSLMETEGFALFKSLFKLVNEKYHKLQILNATRGKTKHQTIITNGATITSTTYGNVSQKKEFIIYVHPDQLLGINIVWRIMMECNNIAVTADCMIFIGNLYSNISDSIEDQRMSIEEDLVKISFQQINELEKKINQPIPESYGEAQIAHWNMQKDNLQKQIERNFMHIKSFMNNSEVCGLDGFVSFDPGYKISFTVLNKISWGKGCHTKKGVPTKFRFYVFQNITLWDLKRYIIDKLKMDQKTLKIEKIGIHSKEFKDSENSRTLKQLGIEDDDKLSVTAKVSANTFDHLSLMFSDGTLTPEASRMFEEVFNLYTTEEGVMNREGAANFLKLCTNQNTKLDDPRVNRLFDSYNQAKDERLTCDEFKQFYIDSIKSKEQTVWSNIRAWSYKTDLKHGTERSERERSTLLRYKIPQNEEDFNSILNLLENENNEIAGSAWRFLSELCLNPEVIEKIITLDLFEDLENKWLESSNPYKLIYVLRIIHFFLHYELNAQAEVRVMFKDEDNTSDKDLNVVGSSILKPVGSGIPPPEPAVPVGIPPESNALSSEGKAHNIVSASANAPPPPPPPCGPNLPTINVQGPEEKKVQFNEEPEEYNVNVYPPGGEVVEDYQMEVEENIQTDTKPDSKVESSSSKPDEIKEENYTDHMTLPVMEIAEKYKEHMVNWVSKFIEKGGYDYVCDLYLSDDSPISVKLNNISIMTEEEKSCSRLLLEIIGVFNIVAAYVNDETIPKDLESQKALDNAQQESDYYNIDEDEVMDADQPKKMRTTSSANKEIDEIILIKAKISLYHEISSPTFCKSITPEFAKRIIEKFNYEKFVKRTLKTLNEILSTRNLSQMDKDIINQNMKVTQNLFLYDERSLSILYNFKDEESNTDLKDFIIRGMTFSTDQEIKSIFMNTLWFICQKIMHTEKERLPLMVILEILKEHFFSNIKDSVRYYGYEEFYNGFCNLLREYFKVRKTPNKKFENILDPRIFLRQLVLVLKDYQTKEKRNTILEDHNLIGMFDIMSCILSEMPELVEPFALEFGLLDELWKNCLFQETVEAPKIDYTTQIEQNNSELHTNKCNTRTSRARAFSLLTLLTTNSAKVRESVYTDCLYKMVSCLERPENFATKSESEARLYSYAGLKNQGATCYMNSMVQQLYMIPAFKYLFLAVDDGKDENYDTNNIEDEKSLYHNKKIDDNLLHQFQNTLAFLELTERQYYNALGLCFAMKDYSGMPTNCSMQQDSQEFLNLCFDRLENLLKPTPQQYVIQDIFGAKQCTHMTCDSCDYVKSRIEDYYILSVPVKGFKSLEESFNSYTDGEIISDFTCDNCEQKVDIKKNCSLINMPNILMIHLQKIHFNVETLMNEKVGDKYEFPTHLDMKNYMINSIAEKHGIKDPELHKYAENDSKNFEYRLVGVIIHQGVADGGHYYSLICTDSNIHDPKQKEWLPTENMKWTEFNDTDTRDYNFRSNFQDDCFGGKSNSYGPALPSEFQSWGGAGASSKSAYVLIYQKREFNDIRLQLDIETVRSQGKTPAEQKKIFEDEKDSYLRSIYSSYNHSKKEEEKEEDIEEDPQVLEDRFMSSLECGDIAVPRDIFPYLVIPNRISVYLSKEEKEDRRFMSVKYDKEKKECVLPIKFMDVYKFIPYKIYKNIWNDNNVFSSERQINNINFLQFFKNTIIEEKIIEQQDNQEKLSLLYDLCVKMIFDMLVYAFNNESIIAVSEVFTQILQLSKDSIVKFSDFIMEDNGSEFIRILFKCGESAVRESVSKILSTAINRMFDDIELIEKAEQFMTFMINSIHTQASANWTKFEQFFNFIHKVAIGGEPQLQYMKKHHVETLLADFFLAERSPIRPKEEKRMCMGNSYSKPMYDSLVQTICYLSRHTDPREEGQEKMPSTIMDGEIFAPGENEKTVIVNKHFGTKAIKDAFEAESVGKLIAHWSYENEENSAIFAGVFLKGINETEYEEVAPFLTAMHHFLALEDSIQDKRYEWLLGTPMLLDGSTIRVSPPEFPKIGIPAIQALSEEIYYYPSTLRSPDSIEESILSLIFRSKKRFESYTLFCIKELLVLGEKTMRYVHNMPPPTYQYARYTDWIFQFVNDKLKSKAKSNDQHRELLLEVKEMLDKYQEDSKLYEDQIKEDHKAKYHLSDEDMIVDPSTQKSEQTEDSKEEKIETGDDQDEEKPVYSAFPKPYLIRKVLKEQEILVKSTDDLRIVLSELECEWTWAKPMGTTIKTAPFLDYYLQRKKNISLWNKKVPVNKSGLNNTDINEPAVDIKDPIFSKKKDMEDEPEKTTLVPIGEEEEDETEQRHPGGNNQEVNEDNNEDDDEDDDEVNASLNDRVRDFDVEAVHEQELQEMNNPVVEDEPIPELAENIQDNQEDEGQDTEEMVEDNPNGPHFEKSPVVMRLAVYNFGAHKAKLEIQLKAETDAPNIYVPLDKIKTDVYSSKNKAVCYFHKIHPEIPFGEISFEYVEIDKKEPEEKPAAPDQQTGTAVGTGTTGESTNIGVENEFDGYQDEISCSACTLLNPLSAHKCSICGATLPHRA